MLTVSFAFVLATALALAFKQTRALGVVGVFVLLCISPLIVGGLLLVAGAVYCMILLRRSHPAAPMRTVHRRGRVPARLARATRAILYTGRSGPH